MLKNKWALIFSFIFYNLGLQAIYAQRPAQGPISWDKFNPFENGFSEP
jgi:hypothetical protein